MLRGAEQQLDMTAGGEADEPGELFSVLRQPDLQRRQTHLPGLQVRVCRRPGLALRLVIVSDAEPMYRGTEQLDQRLKVRSSVVAQGDGWGSGHGQASRGVATVVRLILPDFGSYRPWPGGGARPVEYRGCT
ncbi:hypothetical protein D9M69_633570 [compost metagenome]